MPQRDLSIKDPLEDFERRDFTLLGKTRLVYVSGTGPAVIVMTEVPCISPEVARFARWVREAGFTVYMPHLFGEDGAVPTRRAVAAVLPRLCISAEFRAFARNASSPITQWLRALAAKAHAECGGPGVGAIGMCFTGNFALSMMLEKSVIAPVMSQPSLPVLGSGAMHIAPDELAAVRKRMEDEDLTVLAYRFDGDRHCRDQRFKAFKAALGDRFKPSVLPDSAANPDALSRNPHSVVTAHLIDEAGQPTIKARDEILDFFRMRLVPGA
jgi:dienelactone hydrolase